MTPVLVGLGVLLVVAWVVGYAVAATSSKRGDDWDEMAERERMRRDRRDGDY